MSPVTSSATRVADVTVRDLLPADHDWARELISRLQGSPQVARLGELIDPLTLAGLAAERDGAPMGLATVIETPDKGLEVLLLLADPSGSGAGTALLETARQVAVASGHHRLWLVTTNDNLPAIHFYLRRGLHVAMVHAGAVDADRAVKPEIPAVNADNGLPIRDLVELELTGDALNRPLQTAAFPGVADLDRLPDAAFVAEMAPLVEGAPAFLEALAGARPLETDERLVMAAFDIAHSLPEEARVQLIDAHPRIGAAPGTVSDLSSGEQGHAQIATGTPPAWAPTGDGTGNGAGDGYGAYEDESLFSAAELAEEAAAQRAAELRRADEELAMLNELYEQRFGFRYVIFVAGRPRDAIVPLLEHALVNDREVELRRAVDDAIYIAGDRLRRLRGLGTEV
jgi:2-oxo-4-hydroxy-4-carboxy--5-ureidoimidazoline (OHCU) decarboxylase/GNAT superfamily N-acetyltransferase